MRRFDTFEVYLHGVHVDTVFFLQGESADDVRRSLIEHDGYSSLITVVKVRRVK